MISTARGEIRREGKERSTPQEKISTKSRDGDGKRRGREIPVKDTLHCLKHQKRN